MNVESVCVLGGSGFGSGPRAEARLTSRAILASAETACGLQAESRRETP